MTQVTATKPSRKPNNSRFSSGPTAKRPGWSVEALKDACLGRSHRSKDGKAKLQQVLELTREILKIPADYRIGITAASDTGAVEMALWNLLGTRPVDVFAWEAFGKDWVSDVMEELKVPNTRIFSAKYGELPDLKQANPKHDIVFAWNGTTSGVCVPNADWIADNREGLAICDATSAIFAMPVPWAKLDIVTYSWQKALGGEGQHGMIVLSPRAIERLQSHTPSWPIPKIYRLTKKGKVAEAVFQGDVINTPSMLCVEDVIDAMKWVKQVGGAQVIVDRTRANFKLIADWVERLPWIEFLARDAASRSSTSVCLSFCDPEFLALNEEGRAAFAKRVAALLEKEGAALDVASYRDAPPGLRFWVGGTVEKADVEALLPWVEWAFATAKAELRVAA
ncbi:MAG: phosphoserine transaminase [Proteobacteria bacterium]|nr:phosphoserine transaminase [Pseudomonadota bacterium]